VSEFDWRDLEECSAKQIAEYFDHQKGKWSMDIDCNDMVYAFVNLAKRIAFLEDELVKAWESKDASC
jgi:hypothetical protein